MFYLQYNKAKTNQHQTNVYVFLSWCGYCIIVLNRSKYFQLKINKCVHKRWVFFFYRERLLSRFKTAFNIAILQTQYASYWSFLLNTYIFFNCETRQNLSHYLYGNILLSSQEYNRNYIYHQKYCNLCMLCYMFWCNHVQNTHMDKLFNTK